MIHQTMEDYVRVHTEGGFEKSEKRVFLNTLEVDKHYFFEMERVRDIFLGKLIEKTADANGRITDLVIEHTYNKKRTPTQTSFDIMFVYQMFEVYDKN